MKGFYKAVFSSLVFCFAHFVSFAHGGKEYFQDKDGFFFFLGVHNFTDVHLVWEPKQDASLKAFTLERSEDGINYSPLITHDPSVKLTDLMTLSKEESDKVDTDPYNRLLYTTETGAGRYIYNQLIPDFMLNNKSYQWHYRIKFSWMDGTISYSGVRNFDFFWNYRKMVDQPSPAPFIQIDVSPKKITNEGNEATLQEKINGDEHPETAKKDNLPITLGCPGIGTPPPGSCSSGQTQTLSGGPGSCCTYVQTRYEYPSSNCMGTCCCNIDCSPSSYDSCCVHNCNQHNQCGCTPWLCCGGSYQWITTSVTNQTPPTLSQTHVNVKCNGQCTGSASISATGGTNPLTYTWSPNVSNSSTANNLCAGSYNVTVTDANGCTSVLTVTITQPTVLSASGSSTAASCGQSNGSASVTASGGSPGYTYSWAPTGGNSSTANNLPAGNYSCTVTDANGCTTVVPVTVSSTGAITTSATPNSAVCSQSNGSASVTVTGGSPTFTYVWSPTGGNSSTATGLPAGNYTCTVTDGNGCTSVSTVTIGNTGNASAIFSANTVCLGQPTNFTDQSTSSTGTINSWNWNFGDGNTSIQQNPVHTYTASGTYTVTLTVTDNSGCTSTITNVITVNPQPVANFTSTTVCLGTATQFTDLSTGGGSSWSWNFGDGNTSIQQSPSHTYAAAGNYTATLTVTGPGGCTATISFPVTVYPQPVAAFSATTPVCLGSAIQFTDLSTGGGTSWSWNFGDGNTSTQQSPSHTYTASGTYNVTLVVTASPGNCSATLTQVVTVNPNPVANFSATSVCIGNPTQFTDLSSGGGNSWSWNFGDGNTSTQQNPSNIYANPGNYVVSFTVTANPGGCFAVITQTVTVYPQANANFSSSTVCVNTPATQFTDLSVGASTWSWNFGDPNSGPNNTSAQQSPSHSYTTAGNYSVTLIVASGQGCADTLVQLITVNPKPTAVFSASTVCFNNLTQFTDLSGGNPTQWSWTMPNANPSSSGSQNPAVTYNSWGNYTATLVVTDANGCKDTTTLPVTVNPLPLASFVSSVVCAGDSTCFTDQTSIAAGSITAWSWNFGDASCPNNTSTLQNPCHTYCNGAGTYTVILTSTSNYGCQSTTNMNVTVNSLPVASFTAPNMCMNTVTQFNNTSGNSTQWAWNFGDPQNTTSTLQNPSFTYLGYGTYTVTLIASSGSGCKDTTTQAITVYPLPVVQFVSDSVCKGNPSSFSDLSFIGNGNISSWSWNFGDPSSAPNNTSSLQNPTHVFSNSGNYNVSLTVTSNYGCVSNLTLQAVVFALPIANFSYDPQSPLKISDMASFTDLSAVNITQWNWWFGDGDSISGMQNPTHVYTDTGTYIITLAVIDKNGCRDTIEYPIEILDYSFYIPSAFSPNGDGTNDFFFGKGIGIKHFELWIFDRWGNRIFYCKREGLPQEVPCLWDGKVDGGLSESIVQEDVYVWKVHLVNVFDKEFDYVGTVTVVR
ncbi:MAG: PKD domain-containing protein [Bacteroidetes bacterium]|nr:PKD domain-containing protein [Bacteroidota bacterium]